MDSCSICGRGLFTVALVILLTSLVLAERLNAQNGGVTGVPANHRPQAPGEKPAPPGYSYP